MNKILSYYNNEFLTNVGQYEHNGIVIIRNYRSSLASSSLTNQTLAELAKLTIYKIVLTEGRTNFHYVKDGLPLLSPPFIKEMGNV